MNSEILETTMPEADGPYSCPHFDIVDEQTLRRLFSKVAAVRSEDRQLFDFTHRRIEVFRTPQGNTRTAEVVSEEQIYRQFNESEIGNFAIVIEGEVGTGKSELCAYLAHRLGDDGRPILHVDKDDDLMSLLTERIPEFYRDQFSEKLPGASEFEQLRHDIENNPQTVANNATSGAILNLSSRGYEVAVSEDQEVEICDHVRKELQQLTERGEYAKEVKFVTAGDYKQNDFLDVFAEPVTDEEAVEALNEELWREVRDRYGTASLDDVLEQVGSRFENTRPVIVFEDFSITAMEGKKLRNYMERDKGSDTWDFIVAGTRDSTEVLHTRTAEDRFEFYQTNERNSNSVLFLDEDSAVDFVRPYLGYFKSLDGPAGSVQYNRSEENGDLVLKPAPGGTTCAACGFCDESFRDLFPFNTRFLQRIYTGLNDDQQSPREYVMKVFEVLEEYYHGYVAAPSSTSGLGPLEDPLLIPDSIEEYSEPLAELFRWYGEMENDEIHIDHRFALAFGVVDPTAADSLPGTVTVTDSKLTIPSTDDRPSEKSGKGDVDGPSPPGPTPLEKEISTHEKKVGPWKEYPAQNTQTGIYLKRGLRDSLERLTDGFALYEGTTLQYKLSSQKNPFVMTNTTGTPKSFQIDINPDEFRSSDLRDVLRFGIRRDKKPRTADYDKLLGLLGTQFTGYTDSWRQQLRETFLEADDVFYKRHARYDFTDFVLAAYAFIVAFDSPTKELSATVLNERFADSEEYALPEAIDNWCHKRLDRDQYDHLKEMMGYAEHFEEMVGELLGVSSSNLDLRHVRARFGKNPPYRVLSMLGRQYIGNIDGRVRFDNGPNLRNVASTAYDFRKVIDEIDSRGPLRETTDRVLDEVEGLNLENVDHLVQSLNAYDDVSHEVLESLNRFTSLSDEAINDAVAIARQANALQDSGSGPRQRLQATLMSIHLHHTETYQRYDNVVLDPKGEVNELGQTFQEVAQYYVQ